MHQTHILQKIACPETDTPLQLCGLAEAEEILGGQLFARVELPGQPKPFGVTSNVLVRADNEGAYPIVDGTPILLLPEILTVTDKRRSFDLELPQYAEAYQEMEFYNRVALEEATRIKTSESYQILLPSINPTQEEIESFPTPRHVWLDAVYDCASQWDAYTYLAPIKDTVVMQLGGKGVHAVKFLIAGASESWLVTPMLGEIRCAEALAREIGVEDKLHCVVGVAEEIPLQNGSIDRIFSGGCLHHMQTDIAFPEIARVLSEGGRFGATDPWRAPLYSIGTKILGKREPEVFCRPLTSKRVETIGDAFSHSEVIQHGTFTRYPLLALSKFGIKSNLETVWKINKLDDGVSNLIPGLRKKGSSVATLGTK